MGADDLLCSRNARPHRWTRAVGDQTDHPLERSRSTLERMKMEEEGQLQ